MAERVTDLPEDVPTYDTSGPVNGGQSTDAAPKRKKKVPRTSDESGPPFPDHRRDPEHSQYGPGGTNQSSRETYGDGGDGFRGANNRSSGYPSDGFPQSQQRDRAKYYPSHGSPDVVRFVEVPNEVDNHHGYPERDDGYDDSRRMGASGGSQQTSRGQYGQPPPQHMMLSPSTQFGQYAQFGQYGVSLSI